MASLRAKARLENTSKAAVLMRCRRIMSPMYGVAIAARMPMIATTISISVTVKPRERRQGEQVPMATNPRYPPASSRRYW